MSNVYRYKNCLKLNLWNCNWDNNLPDIDGHATCVFNIITRQFRIWLRPKCVENVWTKLTEITNYSEKTRLYVLNAVERRLSENCSESFPTGVIELEGRFNTEFDSTKSWWKKSDMLESYMKKLFFIFDNYVGNLNTVAARLVNQQKLRCQSMSKGIEPSYMLRLLSPHRRLAYLKRVAPEV